MLFALLVGAMACGQQEEPPGAATPDLEPDAAIEIAADEPGRQAMRRRLSPAFVGPIGPEDLIRDLDRFPPPPEGETRPYPVKTIRVIERTPSSIRLEWHDRSKVEDGTLVRRPGGGSWLEIASYGPVEGYQELLETGLESDTLYCYQFVTFNEHGESPSEQRCAYTRGDGDETVYRAQLRIETAPVRRPGTFNDAAHADTDDRVIVRLNSPPGFYEPSGNETVVDYGRDDFERGDTFTYDLNLDGVSRQSDVTILGITKEGKDPWCIASIELLLNNFSVFSEEYGDTADTCAWLDDAGTSRHTVFHDALRAHPSWSRLGRTIQVTISRDEVESRIEGMVGHLLADEDRADWGDKSGRAWVEAEQRSESTVRVDLDLEGEAPNWFNPSIDLEFDVSARFVPSGDDWDLEIATSNLEVSADFDWFTETLSFLLPCGPVASVIKDEGIPDCIAALEDYIEDRIRAGWVPIGERFAIGSPCGEGDRPHAEVDAGANISLGCVAEDDDELPSRLTVVHATEMVRDDP